MQLFVVIGYAVALVTSVITVAWALPVDTSTRIAVSLILIHFMLK